MSTHSRTRAGLNPEPGTDQFRSKDKVKLVIRNFPVGTI
jgi:hypothetical protein